MGLVSSHVTRSKKPLLHLAFHSTVRMIGGRDLEGHLKCHNGLLCVRQAWASIRSNEVIRALIMYITSHRLPISQETRHRRGGARTRFPSLRLYPSSNHNHALRNTSPPHLQVPYPPPCRALVFPLLQDMLSLHGQDSTLGKHILKHRVH